MKYLLDTCFLSELIRPQPAPGVVSWIHAREESHLYISVLTLGEISRGIHSLPDSTKKTGLREWYIRLEDRFSGRVLPISARVAEKWGELQGRLDRTGKPLPVIDGLLAATCLVHGLLPVTRNDKDFTGFGIDVINPWEKE